MIFELIFWTLITIVCFTWGRWAHYICIRHLPGQPAINLPVDCLIGLTGIGAVSLLLSLLLPEGDWLRLLFLLLPVISWLVSKKIRNDFSTGCSRIYGATSPAGRWLGLACLLTLLFISSAEIIHPDTINYHQFAVRIFADYGNVRGIANARPDLGFQSTWFAVLNIFNPRVLTGTVSFPLAGCVMFWFVAFLITLVPDSRTETGPANKNGNWALALLLMSMLSWTQIRLTAASASPDFIAAMYELAALYFFARHAEPARGDDFLAGFFAGAAMLTKLSAFPIALIPLFLFLRLLHKKHRTGAIRMTISAAIFIIPLLLRSFLASGYLIFPSAVFDVFAPDWKVPAAAVHHLARYITAFARIPVQGDQTERVMALPFRQWVSLWWAHQYPVDHFLTGIVASGFVVQALLAKRWLAGAGSRQRLGWIVAASGTVVWFAMAPDPRFGAGFLMALVAFQFAPLFRQPIPQRDNVFLTKMPRVTQWLAALAIAGYALYRVCSFYTPGQLIAPRGISTATAASPDCTDYVKKMLFPAMNDIGPFPDSCKTFRLRGKTVVEGFRPLP